MQAFPRGGRLRWCVRFLDKPRFVETHDLHPANPYNKKTLRPLREQDLLFYFLAFPSASEKAKNTASTSEMEAPALTPR